MSPSASDKFKKLTNNFSTTLSAPIVGAGDTSMSLASTTNLPTDTGIVLVIDRVNSSGTNTPTTREYVVGTVSGSNVTNLVRGVGNSTAQAHSTGAVVEQVVDQNTINDLIDGILTEHNQDGTHGDVTATSVAVSSRRLDHFAPAGMVAPYAGSTAPTDWLLCDGSAISRTTYADLYTAIGTTYGSGDGSTTFNIPDLRGRVIAGQDDMGGTSANRLTGLTGGVNGDNLGATGGEETHTLSITEMPSHSHTFGGNSGKRFVTPDVNNGTGAGSGSSVWGALTMDSTGGGGAHNNIQPTIILNYIIKT